MRVATLVALALALGAAACASEKPQLVSPGARMIYHGGDFGVFAVCDKGSRIYMTEKGRMVAVVPHACPDGQP